MLSCDNENNAVGFKITLYSEASTPDAVELYEQYLEARAGLKLWGFTFSFRQSLGTIQHVSIKSGIVDDSNPDWFNLKREDRRTIFYPNYGASWQLYIDAKDRFLDGDAEDVIAFLIDLIGPYADTIYREVMPVVNVMAAESSDSIVMEQGDMFWPFIVFDYWRDCREGNNPFCL